MGFNSAFKGLIFRILLIHSSDCYENVFQCYVSTYVACLLDVCSRLYDNTRLGNLRSRALPYQPVGRQLNPVE